MASTSTTGLVAEIITTGTEILLGEIVDTNAAWIAQQLRDSGINLYFKSTVGDNEARLRSLIELGLSRSDVLIVTGGLGPTADDITRDSIANATGCPLELHQGALETLEARFARFGSVMTENNRQQALIPQGATIIENPVGTAPGFMVETAQGMVIALPGVPREMKRLMTDTVLPLLRGLNGGANVIRRRVLRTIGLGESTIDHRLRDLMNSANPTIGLAAHVGQVDVRITASAANEQLVEEMLIGLEQTVRERIGEHIYSTTPKEALEDVVVEQLRSRRATVAVLESSTRGALAQQLSVAVQAYNPVNARWVLGDLSTNQKIALLDGTSVELSAAAMRVVAERARDLGDATFGVVLLGTEGDDDGIFGTQEGETWVAVAAPDGTQVQRIPYGGHDEHTQVRLVKQGLYWLWRTQQEALQ